MYLTMNDLKNGALVRHVERCRTGQIRRAGNVAEIRWDDSTTVDQVSNRGPIFPEDLELLGPLAALWRIGDTK